MDKATCLASLGVVARELDLQGAYALADSLTGVMVRIAGTTRMAQGQPNAPMTGPGGAPVNLFATPSQPMAPQQLPPAPVGQQYNPTAAYYLQSLPPNERAYYEQNFGKDYAQKQNKSVSFDYIQKNYSLAKPVPRIDGLIQQTANEIASAIAAMPNYSSPPMSVFTKIQSENNIVDPNEQLYLYKKLNELWASPEVRQKAQTYSALQNMAPGTMASYSADKGWTFYGRDDSANNMASSNTANPNFVFQPRPGSFFQQEAHKDAVALQSQKAGASAPGN